MLLRLTDRGLYCEAGDFFVDPWGAVDRAVVTHAHGDHVAWGCRAYLTSSEGLGVLRSRLAPEARRERPAMRRARHDPRRPRLASIPPATSSARPRSASSIGGEVWVVSGDYKTEPDPTCAPFEPVRCHTFVTESTFGLPIYRWPPQQDVLRRDQRTGGAPTRRPARRALLFGYALGKAQRLLAGLDPASGRSTPTARSSG